MNKHAITITTLGLLAILSVWLVIHISCKKENSCPGCSLTNEQLSFICCSGSEAIFKNDTTNALDTLYASDKSYGQSFCSDYCDEGYGSVIEGFTFSHLSPFYFQINAGDPSEIPDILFSIGISFGLNSPTQTVTVNGITYNDVYSTQIDSTKITTANKQTVPWKIYYSKSQGFVRFYMMNGQTWSKL
jgi:hypothetical protein